MKVLLAFVASFVVTFCAVILIVNATKDDDKSVPAPTVTSSTPTPTPSVTPSETPVEKEQPTLKYGETFQYDDGLRVTVSAPKEYPKDPTVKMARKHYKYYSITVTNTLRKSYETNYFEVTSHAGDEYGQYTATEGNGFPTAPLAKGESLTFTVAYGYNSDAKPTVSFNPFVDREMPDILIVDTVTWA